MNQILDASKLIAGNLNGFDSTMPVMNVPISPSTTSLPTAAVTEDPLFLDAIQ